MVDIAIEIARALITLAIFVSVLVAGRKFDLANQRGWHLIVAGFGLLLFASLIDITDNFESLNRFVVIGDTEVQGVLEKLFGYLLGFILLCVGFWSWLPVAGSPRARTAGPGKAEGELGSKVSRRALQLIAIVVTGIFIVATWVALLLEHIEEYETLETRAKFLADLQADALVTPLWNFEYGQASLMIEMLARDPDFLYGILRDGEGNILAQVGDTNGETADDAQDVVRESRSIVYMENGDDEDQESVVLGELIIGLSPHRVESSLITLTAGSLAMLAVILTFVLGAVMIAMRLITAEFKGANARLQQEIEERRSAEETAHTAEAQNRLILESAGDGIYGIDLQGKTTFVNKAAASMVGYSLEELIGQPIHDLIHHSYPDGTPYPIHECPIYATMADGEMHMVENEVLWRKDGTSFPIEYTSTPLTKDQTIVGAVVTFRDITERLKVDRMKTEFISTVSHELRTPLTSVFGSLGLMRGGAVGELSDQAKKMIDIAYKNTDRLIRLINDILDLEKMESGRMQYKLETLEVSKLVERSIEANKSYAKQYNVTFALVGTVPKVKIHADRDKLEQVLTNLFSNAAKFSPENGVVEVAIIPADETVRVSVTDQGPGISQEFRGRIFEKFSQADSSDTRQKGGTGLGLAICKAIIEELGGTIALESETGKGTTVFFDLPMPSQAEAVSPVTIGMKLGQHRILVCEDDHDIAKRLESMVEQNGLVMDVAKDAEEAGEILAKVDHLAVVLDLDLNGEDTTSLMPMLREQQSKRELPVIAVAADIDRRLEQLGPNGPSITSCLAKPVDKRALEEALECVISRSRQERPRLLHVENDVDVQMVVSTLVGASAAITTVSTFEEAARMVTTQKFDLVVLDLMLPDGEGEDLIPLIRRSPNRLIPVIVFSALELSREATFNVQAALVKSRASGEDLLEVINAAIEGHKSTLQANTPHTTPEAMASA